MKIKIRKCKVRDTLYLSRDTRYNCPTVDSGKRKHRVEKKKAFEIIFDLRRVRGTIPPVLWTLDWSFFCFTFSTAGGGASSSTHSLLPPLQTKPLDLKQRYHLLELVSTRPTHAGRPIRTRSFCRPNSFTRRIVESHIFHTPCYGHGSFPGQLKSPWKTLRLPARIHVHIYPFVCSFKIVRPFIRP